MIKFSKPKYPTKKTMNLAVQEKNKLDIRILLFLWTMGILCFLFFMKFAVIDLFMEARETKELYAQMEEQRLLLEEKTKGFEQVKQQYRQFDESLLSESERTNFDRMEMIKIIESCVGKNADIGNMIIKENQVILQLNHTTLSSISKIVDAFENNKNTSYVMVLNASTEVEKETDQVVAELLIQMKNGGIQS